MWQTLSQLFETRKVKGLKESLMLLFYMFFSLKSHKNDMKAKFVGRSKNWEHLKFLPSMAFSSRNLIFNSQRDTYISRFSSIDRKNLIWGLVLNIWVAISILYRIFKRRANICWDKNWKWRRRSVETISNRAWNPNYATLKKTFHVNVMFNLCQFHVNSMPKAFTNFGRRRFPLAWTLLSTCCPKMFLKE